MRVNHFVAAFVGATCLLVSGSASAQQPSADEIKQMEAMMAPGENHELLKFKEGSWNLTVKMWMVPDAPPTVSEATAEFKMILGGRYMADETTGTFNGMKFEGKGLTGYNNATKKFFGAWIDNMGTGMMTTTGEFNPEKKEWTYKLTSPHPLTGEPDVGRAVERIVDDNTWIMQSFRTGPDGKERQDMEITYKRKK